MAKSADPTIADLERENAWLLRTIAWCSARLNPGYRLQLAERIEAGPTDPDPTPVVQSDDDVRHLRGAAERLEGGL